MGTEIIHFIEDTSYMATLCINCMQEKVARVCPHCGYDERKYQSHPLYLKPRTLLKERYIIGKALGQGGFGITYIGLDTWLQKRVAIKEYLPAALATRDFVQSTVVPLKKQEFAFSQGLGSFIDEARNLARFDHPNIVRVLNFFEDKQTGYMVMDYLAGSSPIEMLNRSHGKLSVAQTFAIVLPLLDALAEIHSQQIYHRDISLQNIRILINGAPVLIDFGAARQIVGENSHSLDLVLKHGYSPIEQYSGKGKIGAWTDIYACGALFYLLLTGHLPPPATDRLNGDQLIAPSSLRGEAISPTLDQTILRALAIYPEDRFQSIAEFKAALEDKEWIVPTLPKTARKKIVAVALVALLLAVFPTLLWFQPPPPVPSTVEQAVTQLLAKAQRQWLLGNLTAPSNDNAYDTYQQLLTIAPQHPEAQSGITRIVAHYQQVTETALQQERFAESLAAAKQGLQIAPTHSELIALEKQLSMQLANQERAQTVKLQVHQLLTTAAQQVVALHLETAYKTYQQVLSLEPHNTQAQTAIAQIAQKYEQLAQEQNSLLVTKKGLALFPEHVGLLTLHQELTKRAHIQELLQKAEQQIATLRLTEPVNENAYQTYQQVLTLVPDNAEAKAGLVKIADVYARLAKEERDLRKGLIFVEKGLKVLPTHSELLDLNKTLTQQFVKPESPKIAPVVVTPVIIPPDSAEKPRLTPPTVMLAPPNNPINNLLSAAKQKLEAGQLEAAAQTYKNVLLIEPANESATLGLQQVTARYEQLARSTQGNLTESLAFIDKGLAIDPLHIGLQTLREEINQRLQKANADNSNNPRIIFNPSF